MTHNPYSPPGTAVADAVLPERGPRPWQVTTAVILCWAGLVITLPEIVLDFANSDPDLRIGLGILASALVAFAVLLIVQIGRGRNWARIVYAVLVLLGFLMDMAGGPEETLRPWYFASAYWLSSAFDAVVLVLVFLPASNAWFRSRRN